MAVSTFDDAQTKNPNRKVLASSGGAALAIVITKVLFKRVFTDWQDDPEMEQLVIAVMTGLVGGLGALLAGYFTPPHPKEGVMSKYNVVPSVVLAALLTFTLTCCSTVPPADRSVACGAVGTLEQVLAEQHRAGLLSSRQVTQVDQAVDQIDPYCKGE